MHKRKPKGNQQENQEFPKPSRDPGKYRGLSDRLGVLDEAFQGTPQVRCFGHFGIEMAKKQLESVDIRSPPY